MVGGGSHCQSIYRSGLARIRSGAGEKEGRRQIQKAIWKKPPNWVGEEEDWRCLTWAGKALWPVGVFKEVGWDGRKCMSLISDTLSLEFEGFLNLIRNRELFAWNDQVSKI